MILVRKTCRFVIDVIHCINSVVRKIGDVVFLLYRKEDNSKYHFR